MSELMAKELTDGQPSADFTPAVAKLFECRITEKSDISQMTFLFKLFGVACFPRGELVAVAGKAKSGKTFFLSLLMAAGRFNPNLNANLNPNEGGNTGGGTDNQGGDDVVDGAHEG